MKPIRRHQYSDDYIIAKNPKTQERIIKGMARVMKMAYEFDGKEFILYGPAGHKMEGKEMLRGNFTGVYRGMCGLIEDKNGKV